MSIDKYQNRDKFVDLKLNGRLFPSWVNMNFKKYQLEEVLNRSDDPCNIKADSGEIKLELKKYQEFLGKFLSFNSPYKEALVYFNVGFGKTLTAINTYNVLVKLFLILSINLLLYFVDNISIGVFFQKIYDI